MSDQIVPKGLFLIILVFFGSCGVAAVWRDTRWSSGVKVVLSAGLTVPSLAFIYVFVIRIHWYPGGEGGTP